MRDSIPRLRMFAGPNGSGKTTVKNALAKPAEWFGIYINPDDMEAVIRRTGALPLEPMGIKVSTEAIRHYMAGSRLLANQGLEAGANTIECSGDRIEFGSLDFNSYHASVLADFLRREALAARRSFSFETVMSAPDKVELLREAQSLGYRTYLYYFATVNPAINVQRVKNRLAEGGHDVPEEKIIARYQRSLELAPQAVRFSNRAFLFDTSEETAWFFAETNETNLELKSEEIPSWFVAPLHQLESFGYSVRLQPA